MNAWDDERVRKAVAQAGQPKLIIAGLWTEVCVTMPMIEALRGGYQAYVVTDASGGTTKEAHEMAVARMVQAGAVPVTWQQVMLEWQRDWARQETYAAVNEVIREHSGAYGMGEAADAGAPQRSGVAFGQPVTIDEEPQQSAQ